VRHPPTRTGFALSRARAGCLTRPYPSMDEISIRGAIPDPHTVDEMPMTTVVTIIVMIVIVARSGSSMVTVMIARDGRTPVPIVYLN
jgi:hypothetical protein